VLHINDLTYRIEGRVLFDQATLAISEGQKVGLVGRNGTGVPSGPESLIQTVLIADKERTSLMAEAETATDPMRIAAIHTRLSDIDAYSAEARAAIILSGLGFDAEDQPIIWMWKVQCGWSNIFAPIPAPVL